MAVILSTYRVQLSRDFTLADLRRRVPYLARLGITHLYLSPIFKARCGSAHGYDVVDPTRLDPERGSRTDFDTLAASLRQHDMGLVLDIVPNHMATGSENVFWEDVLTHGRLSPFAHWFDIDWGEPEARRRRRIFLPVLGDRIAQVIERGELRLVYQRGAFRLEYYDQTFPLDPASAAFVLEAGLDQAIARENAADVLSELATIVVQARSLPPLSSPNAVADGERGLRAGRISRRLDALARSSPVVRSVIESALDVFNTDPARQSRMRRLLAGQAYRLAYWRRAAREINYRRFFTISHLVALRMEDPQVFAATHTQVLDWISQGKVDGLRVDHIDGLLDPRGYLEKLSEMSSVASQTSDPHRFPIFVEKILARDEQLVRDWPVAGTTGYDFLNEVEDLFIADQGFRAIERGYNRFVGRGRRFADVRESCKRSVLNRGLTAELKRLVRQLDNVARTVGRADADLGPDRLGESVIETLISLPVYRTYIDPRDGTWSPQDREVLTRAIARAETRGRADKDALRLLARALLLEDQQLSTNERQLRIAFAQRFQQTAAAVAAKGVEDTAFYIYVPLAARNEVGGEPDSSLDAAAASLHSANRQRAELWAGTILCTSSHDTKRSADVSARLDVLSELPQLWLENVRRWHRWNRGHRTRIGWHFAPDRNSEYLFYQTLVGIWPLSTTEQPDAELPSSAELSQLRSRVREYMEKAVREAKVHTSWVNPSPRFESALSDFIDKCLSPDTGSRFLEGVHGFSLQIARPALWNALARTLIQMTAPGTPDVYQGDELWNFALVDPDNRQPVDFAHRQDLLEDLRARFEAPAQARLAFLSSLAEKPEDGRIKLHVVHRSLLTRHAHSTLFTRGRYIPVAAEGPAAQHVFAFARLAQGRTALTVVPRLMFSLSGDPALPPRGDRHWSGTTLALPPEVACERWSCVLSGQALETSSVSGGRRLSLSETFSVLPVALLLGTLESEVLKVD